MLKLNRKRLKKLWQFSIFIICCVTLSLLFIYSKRINNLNHQMLYDQTETLSRVITRQAANTLSIPVKLKNDIEIQKVINNLYKEELIYDVSVYDLHGMLISASEDMETIAEITGLYNKEGLSISNIGRQQLIEPIFDADNAMIGFVRVTLEHADIIQETSNKMVKHLYLLQILIVVSLITGAFIISATSRRLNKMIYPFLHKK